MKSVDGLHVILGGHELTRTLELAHIAEVEGASVVQLREKFRSTNEILTISDALRNIIHRATLIIVNDRADIALATGADGVHLGQDDLANKRSAELLGSGCDHRYFYLECSPSD